MNYPTRDPRGFTLLEVFVALAVLGVLLLIAIPSFSDFIDKREAVEAIQNLKQGFSLARSEAVKRRTTVTICALDAAAVCSNDWSQDIAIFEDDNGDRVLSAGDEIIFRTPASDSGHFHVLVSTRNYFQYGATGSARNTMGSVVFCPTSQPSDGTYLKLVIHLSGRTRVDRFAGAGACPN